MTPHQAHVSATCPVCSVRLPHLGVALAADGTLTVQLTPWSLAHVEGHYK